MDKSISFQEPRSLQGVPKSLLALPPCLLLLDAVGYSVSSGWSGLGVAAHFASVALGFKWMCAVEEQQRSQECYLARVARAGAESENALKSALDKGKEDRAEASRLAHELEDTLTSTRAELETTKAERAATKTELVGMQTAAASLEAALSTTTKELKSTQAELKSTQAELNSTQAELVTLKEELEIAAHALTQSENTVSEQEESLAAATAKLKAYIDQIVRPSCITLGRFATFVTGATLEARDKIGLQERQIADLTKELARARREAEVAVAAAAGKAAPKQARISCSTFEPMKLMKGVCKHCNVKRKEHAGDAPRMLFLQTPQEQVLLDLARKIDAYQPEEDYIGWAQVLTDIPFHLSGETSHDEDDDAMSPGKFSRPLATSASYYSSD